MFKINQESKIPRAIDLPLWFLEKQFTIQT